MKTVLGPLILVTLVLDFAVPGAQAGLEPGEIVDSTNFQEIEGLVPDYIVTWVKNGDMVMKLGKRNYDAARFWSQEVLDNWEGNIGRFEIDEHNGLIDKATGKPARGVKGFPFPEPDSNDPKVPIMLLWNVLFREAFLQGNTHAQFFWYSFRRGGLEKVFAMENRYLTLDPAKSEMDYAQLSVFRQPFSMANTGTLVIYPLYPLGQGVRFAYAPELRKVKRLSHRLAGSDTHFGLDAAPDDSWSGGPKTNFDEGRYRFIDERDALVPVFLEDPRRMEWNEKGELEVGYDKTGTKIEMGYETKGWKGAPWHVTNIVWVKSRVYVFESKSTAVGYAYGPGEGWVEKGTFAQIYKRIVDPNGELWKGFYWPVTAFQSADGKYRLVDNAGQVVVDMRRDHGSTYPNAYREGGFKRILIQKPNEELFTQSGFVKLCQ